VQIKKEFQRDDKRSGYLPKKTLPYLVKNTARSLWWSWRSLFVMDLLDNTIVNVAIPSIQANLAPATPRSNGWLPATRCRFALLLGDRRPHG